MRYSIPFTLGIVVGQTWRMIENGYSDGRMGIILAVVLVAFVANVFDER